MKEKEYFSKYQLKKTFGSPEFYFGTTRDFPVYLFEGNPVMFERVNKKQY